MSRPRRSIPVVAYAEDEGSGPEDVDTLTFRDDNDPNSSQNSPEDGVSQFIQPLTSSQVIETQNLVEKETIRLDTLNQEYADLEKKLSSLNRERLAVAQSIFTMRARLSIMCRIPQDVLSMIFVHFVTEFRQSPWTLMHVNRKWRQTSLQTRRIWSGIEIASILWYRKAHPRSRDGREVCTTEEQLQRALNRAGHADLDVKIFDRNPSGRYWSSKASMNIVKVLSLFDSLGRDGSLRVVRLETPGERFFLYRPFRMKDMAFTRLRELKLKDDHPQLIQHVASSAATLQKFDIDRISFNTIDLTWPWWPKLISLKLALDFPIGVGGSSSSLLTNLFAKTSSLRHLKLLKYYTLQHSPPELMFPQLLTLSTDAFLGSARISAPLLTHLTLYEGKWRDDEPKESIQPLPPFPSLIHLEVQCEVSRLRYIQAPSLHTLNLDLNPAEHKSYCDFMRTVWFDPARHPEEYNDYGYPNSDGSSPLDRPDGYRPNVLHPPVLRINKIPIHQDVLFQILGSMDRLEELYIQGTMVMQSFFVQLSKIVTATNSHPSNFLGHSTKFEYPDFPNSHNLLLIPLLKKLSIDISNCKEAKDVNYMNKLLAAARKCFKIRRKYGSVIESARIRVAKDSDWIVVS